MFGYKEDFNESIPIQFWVKLFRLNAEYRGLLTKSVHKNSSKPLT